MSKPALLQTLILPLGPAIETVRTYQWVKFRCDVVAGLTVAMVALPQAMAYALIAKLPPVYGIYAAIIQGMVAAFFTSSSHLSTGPVNALSLIIASAIGAMTAPEDQRVLYAMLMALMVGVIQIGCAIAKLGGLVRYVSHEVVVGFTAGAGILIAVGQVPNFLGMSTKGATSPLPGELLQAIHRLIQSADQVSWPALSIGAMTIALVLIARRVSRLIPGPLIAVIVSALLVWVFGWTGDHLPLIGAIPTGLPEFQAPPLAMPEIQALFGAAMALALVGILEAYSIAKAIAARTGEPINANREFLAQGSANMVASFFQGMPGSGSLSRTALNYNAGAATRFAGVFCSVFIAVMFLLLAPQAGYIPLSSLAAILFIIAFGLIDWKHILRVARSSKPDCVVCLTTLVACLLVPLEFAIFVGVLINFGVFIRRTSHLHINAMEPTLAGPFVERPLQDREGNAKVMFLQVEGDLFFGVADELHAHLSRLVTAGHRVLILRLKRIHSLDSTVMGVLEQATMQMQARGGHIVLCGVKPELMHTLRAFGLIDLIGVKNVFETSFGIFTSAKRAIQRARELVGTSLDTEHLGLDGETEGWAYEI